MAKPVLAELLRFIAANEELPRTLERYKGYDRDVVGKLIAAAADRVEQAEAAAGDPPPGRKRLEVRKPGEERAAARPAEATAAARTRLFTDGAARGNPGPAGAGAVILNPQGHIVAKVGKFLGENTNNYAEYMGLILGLRRAKAMGIKELEVFADSELLVRQLNGEYQVKAENLKPLFEEARQLLSAFPEVRVRHIRREENEAADEMSNRAIDQRL
ncbi:MAG TPA: ribonuclease HI family protein [Anaeromyxobacteraceae bacterium]